MRTDGAVAATVVGGLAAGAGWAWASVLVGWFVASSALTRLGHRLKATRTAGTLAPSGARNARQVLANGAVFSIAAVVFAITGDVRWGVAALGALAAAAADTWATETGLLWGRSPRSILTGAIVEPGLSGGVTWLGTLGGVAGALAVGAAAVLVLPHAAAVGPVVLGGIIGGLADSVLGAAVQAKRRCATCARWTERDPHDCGSPTTHARGWRWMTNDIVNLLTTLIGAGAAVALAALRS